MVYERYAKQRTTQPDRGDSPLSGAPCADESPHRGCVHQAMLWVASMS